MPISNSMKYGTPIRLIRDGEVIIETRGDPHWAYDDVTDHYGLAVSFIEYVDSVRTDLAKDKKREPLTEDFDFVEIQYSDRTLRYRKDEVVVCAPVAKFA